MSVVSAAFAFTIAWVFAVELQGAAEALVESLERIADGDLRQSTGIRSDDELGLVAQSCDRVVVRLAEVVDALSLSSAELDAAGLAIDRAASEVVESSERQSARLRARGQRPCPPSSARRLP